VGNLCGRLKLWNSKVVKGGGVTTLKLHPQSGNMKKVKELLLLMADLVSYPISAEDYLLMASYSSSSIAL